MWVVDVPVATIWTSPQSPRDIDYPGLTNPLHIELWYKILNHNLRLELSDKQLTQSQALLGEEVIIDNFEKEWAHIIAVNQPTRKDPRGYPGWIPIQQITQVEKNEWRTKQQVVVIKPQATLYNKDKQPLMKLSFATTLPFIKDSINLVEVKLPNAIGYLSKDDVTINRENLDIIDLGMQFIGLPYFWGGMSSYGYDCSGFTYSIHKAAGVIIPRDASDQIKQGKRISLKHISQGDLLFFQNKKGNVHHVGLYVGEGRMLHSPHTGKSLEIIKIDKTKYEQELCAVRRYLD